MLWDEEDGRREENRLADPTCKEVGNCPNDANLLPKIN
jgi:hypothetical protein